MDQVFFIVLVITLPLFLYEAFSFYWERRKERLREERIQQKRASVWTQVEDFLSSGWNFDPFMNQDKICRSRTWRRRTPSGLVELEISGSESAPMDVRLLAFVKLDDDENNESWEASMHAEFEEPTDLLRFLKTDLIDCILKVRIGAAAMTETTVVDEEKPSTDEEEPQPPS